ncbi:glycosyltransferase [Caloramator australicus]|uniref:N-acetylglucosaminyl-phosphatidylinositol biosynthetic protein n=1 Tax=Caloramator australicus RC3 TaxID=857293 RepID=G0V436_9CLOT|nr:glycosyltransferase [Caloramator australicus]CCC57876.1 N-acetylglucosaminyl-phosphatidylinositol biosynthetic protein [Caloramator australicus RC3]
MEKNKKKRIICFFPTSKRYYGMGGAERRIPYIFSNLDNTKFDVTILFQVYDGQSEKILKDIKKYINSNTKIVFIKGYLKILIYLIKQKFDWVCYTDCIIRSTVVIIGAILSGSYRLMMSVTTTNSKLIFKSRIEKMLFKVNVLLSNQIDCLYPSSINILKKAFPQKKISLTPCTLSNMQECIPSTKKRNYIVFAGRLVDGKGIELFVDAIFAIKEVIRKNEYLCVICGDGPLKSIIEAKVQNYNITDIVKVKGYTNVRKILSEAKIFCSLQNVNNYPSQSLLEAIACGCYCIATNVGDTENIIDPSFGELIDADKKSLANALLTAISFENDKWEDISKKASKYAISNFDLKNAVNHFEELFQK